MELDKFEEYCSEFFCDERFKTNESIEKLISGMTIQEFNTFDRDLMTRYWNTRSPILQDLINNIRYDSGFDFDKDDYENDPIRLQHNRELIGKYKEILVRNSNTLYEFPSYKKKHDESIAAYAESLKKKTVTVSGEEYKIVDSCDVYWCGWESDETAYVVQTDSGNKLVVTNHGDYQFSDINFLNGKLSEYEEAISETTRMIDLLS